MQREMSISGQEKPTLFESSPLFTDDYDFSTSFFHSIFPPKHSPLHDYLNDGSSNSSSRGSGDARTSCLPQIQQQLLHQDLMDRHLRVLSQLNDVVKHTQVLRQENVNLKTVNRDLHNRMNLILNAPPFNGVDLGPRLDSVVDGLRKLGFGAEVEGMSHNEAVSMSPTSVMDSGGHELVGTERVQLPKSISVRSSEYLKAIRAGGSSGKGVDSTKASNENEADNVTQKVYVKGPKKEKPLELEVYNQGMLKTELCNKWQQTGTCPYGDNCQFAHGVEELRPVLRHPRYKTEVCRMVLNNIPCPYGHRCHFRHALTDQEKLTKAMNSTTPLEPLSYR